MGGNITKGKVYKYDLKGNYLCEYENSAIASFMNNLSVGHMNLHLNGKYSFYHNHIYTRIFYMILPSELLVNKNVKEVHQYSTDGNYIKTFNSPKEASLEVGIPAGSISYCLNGKTLSGGGFIWSYIKLEKVPKYKKYKYKTKKIHQYSTDGKYIKTFNSSKDADLEFGVRHGAISMCANGKISTAYGFIWRHIKVKKVLKSERKIKYKKIHQYDLNGKYLKTFNSYKEAILEVGIGRTTISMCANGKKPSGGGYIWKYKKN